MDIEGFLTAGTAPAPTERILMGLLDELPVGVVVLDRDGRVVFYNAYEEQLAQRSATSVLGRDFFGDVAPCLDVRALGRQFRRSIGKRKLQARLEVSFPLPHVSTPREVAVRMSSFVLNDQPFGCLFVEDVSSQRAVERMKETLNLLLVHDLKNPLAVVAGNLGLIEKQPGLQADLREAVDDATRALARLNQMVMNLLDITRIETGAVPLARRPVDVPALLREVASDAALRAASRGLTVVVDAPAMPPWNVDAGYIRRCLENLVDNALRFGPAGTDIRPCARLLARSMVLEVTDRGPGVPAELRERIFDPGVRAAAGTTSLNRGLGLSLVRLAARAHGGKAEVRPAGTHGSRFRIVLPRAVVVAGDT